MAVSGFEIIGRSGNNNGVTRRYRVDDAVDDMTDTAEEKIAAFISGLPAEIADFPFSDFSYNEKEEDNPKDGPFEIEVQWGAPQSGGGGSDQTIGTSQYRFNFQAQGGHFLQALSTISAHSATGSFATPVLAGVPDFHGAINVTNTDGKKKVEGQNVNAPAENFTLNYKATDAQIDGDYQLLVEGLMGRVNSIEFRGRAAGCVMFTRCVGQRQSGIWNVEFGFAHIPVQTNIPVGDEIVVDTKDGFDLLWPYYESKKDEDFKDKLPNPLAAYVERVFFRADLNTLALPS